MESIVKQYWEDFFAVRDKVYLAIASHETGHLSMMQSFYDVFSDTIDANVKNGYFSKDEEEKARRVLRDEVRFMRGFAMVKHDRCRTLKVCFPFEEFRHR